MQPVWLDRYPAGVPHRIAPEALPESLNAFFEQGFSRFAVQPAFECMGAVLTYAQLDALSARFASYLAGSADIRPDDRVALMLPNLLQYPVALIGALRAGAIVVNVNPLYTARELRHQLSDAGATVIVVLEQFAATLADALSGLTSPARVIVTSVGELLGPVRGPAIDLVLRHVKRKVPAYRIDGAVRFRDALAQASGDLPRVSRSRDDLAFLQYTGGTTGRAKGAMLTHGNLLANIAQARAWIDARVVEGGECILTALPLCHIFSLTANFFTYFQLGARNVLVPNPRDLDALVGVMCRHRFTAMTGVNTLYGALMSHPRFGRIDFSGMKIALGGGTAVQRPIADRWSTLTGTVLLEAYGLTEASPAVCINPMDLTAFNHSVGLPLPSTELSIRRPDGSEAALGEEGELCVRGPQVMRGYWQCPGETRAVFTDDGFLRTGDVAVIGPEGFVRLVDRMKDVILVSGFNVYPGEIEEVVMTMPGVLEVAAIAVEDERTGEAVKIFVVHSDKQVSVDAVLAHCRANLTGYKVPRHVAFRDHLPKSHVGKILRRMLRDGSDA